MQVGLHAFEVRRVEGRLGLREPGGLRAKTHDLSEAHACRNANALAAKYFDKEADVKDLEETFASANR
jgi:hypothetical protein